MRARSNRPWNCCTVALRTLRLHWTAVNRLNLNSLTLFGCATFLSWLSANGPLAASTVTPPLFFSGTVDSITTGVNAANEVLLESIQFNNGLGNISIFQMVGVSSVFHYAATPSNAPVGNPPFNMPGTLSIVSPKSDSLIPAGQRSQLLAGDTALNTGLTSVGLGSGITAGPLPAQLPQGLGVSFGSPIVNKPGFDIILFDLSMGSVSTHLDEFTVSGVSGSNSTGFTNPAISAHSGEFSFPALTYRDWSPATYRQGNPVASLTELEQKSLFPMAGAKILDWGVRLYTIDLDNLNIPPDGTVTGIFIQSSSTSIDPTFIAGLYSVPEPGTAFLLLCGLATIASSRYRRKSRLN